MRKKLHLLAGALAPLAVAVPAEAHVTVQPTEAVANSFARFVVRVPNERPNASTVKVEVQLPENLVLVSFQDTPGWQRTVERRTLAQPVEVFGQRLTDYVASVTWEGGRVEPGEFEEFGFSARLPERPTTLRFPALQTYDSGEVVRWVGPPDAEEPAAQVTTLQLGGAEGVGQLRLLAQVAAGASEREDEGIDAGVVLGGIGVALGAVALVVAVTRGRSS